MELADKVKYVRAKLRLTQEELAIKTGIPKDTIVKWENQVSTKPQMSNYGKFMDFCEGNNINFKDVKEIF